MSLKIQAASTALVSLVSAGATYLAQTGIGKTASNVTATAYKTLAALAPSISKTAAFSPIVTDIVRGIPSASEALNIVFTSFFVTIIAAIGLDAFENRDPAFIL